MLSFDLASDADGQEAGFADSPPADEDPKRLIRECLQCWDGSRIGYDFSSLGWLKQMANR